MDGVVTNDDRWNESEEIPVEIKGVKYITSIKHDMEYLYILMRWQDTSQWENKISLYFKQDGSGTDSNIYSGRIDRYYQENNSYLSAFTDGHYSSGYVQDVHQDGSLKVGYDNNMSEWVMEWKIPLSSGDMDDIYVNKYPEVVKFSIINEVEGKGGILPPFADKNDPDTWAKIKIISPKST